MFYNKSKPVTTRRTGKGLEALTTSGELYRKILDSVSDGVYFVDRDRRITFWNKGAERLTGYSSEKVVGTHCSDNLLMHINDSGKLLCHTNCPLKYAIADGQPHKAQVYLRHSNGHRIPVYAHIEPLMDDTGAVIGAVETFSDNSAQLIMQKQLDHLQKTTLNDKLTGIGNRKFLEVKLESSLSEFRQHNLPFGVLLIDITNWQEIIQTYEAEIGEKVLKMVTNTITGNTSPTDIPGRWQPAQFMLIVPQVNERQLLMVAHTIQALIVSSWLSVEPKGKRIHVHVSIGATLSQDEDTSKSVSQRVEQALVQSKQLERNQVAFV